MFSIALLLFCFQISNLPTRIFVAITSVMVAALILWCVRSAWESTDERGAWLSSASIVHALSHVYDARKEFLAMILRRRETSSLPYNHSGNLHPMTDRGGVGV